MRYYILAAACLMAGFASEAVAKDLGPKQKKLRIDIVQALGSKGYDAFLDSDGDVYFNKNGKRYWVGVNENWENPFIISIYCGDLYDNAGGFSKRNVEACVSMVNQTKTVKLYCEDYSYTLRSDILCKDADVFRQTFEAIVAEQEKAGQYLTETITAGLGGLDLTGNKEAVYQNALKLYNKGDYYKAFRLFSFLADSDYAPAYGMLGLAYENGEGTAKDESQMVANYEKALAAGEAWCAYNLGCHYYNKKSYAKAMEYFTQASASENPCRSDAYYMVGKMYENGTGAQKNLTRAIQNYRKSVEYSTELECDARNAMIRLGEPVENPRDFVDISKGLLSGLSADAMFKKGYEYEHGLNSRTVSLPKAYGYYKAAADNGNTDAVLKMGEIYISPYYPFNDKDQSDKYYAKALKALKRVESYSDAACYQLGMIYKNGLSVPKDQEQAMAYFKSAAAKGNVNANYELGLIYQSESEYVDGFNYFLKAADKGMPKAMYEVARAYETGIGTPRNRENAVKWYSKCAAQDSDYKIARDANSALKKLGSVDDEKE